MSTSIDDQVIDFYEALFENIFSKSFQPLIANRLKRNAVIRQVQESADAASQSLIRFFVNQQLTEQQVADILIGFATLNDHLKLDDISRTNVAPETIVEILLPDLPCPEKVQQEGSDAVYRVALHSVVQVLMFVGPVMAEWQKLNFSTTFELPGKVVNRLNQISDQLGVFGRSGQVATDERYELSFRDYLMQRFYRVEAGTVRMTTNLDVDLRELFVMPCIQQRPLPKKSGKGDSKDVAEFMDLAAARGIFSQNSNFGEKTESKKKKTKKISALDQVKRNPRNVIVGLPGSGKSTFFEWLQIKIASGEEELIMDGEQAIPLLLRVRQLDIENLPQGAAIIEKATASKDRAKLMPSEWIQRQMEKGRVLFMLDGLDETEPELRDQYLIPWLKELYNQFPDCHYLVSSRPVGYPAGMLRKLEFAECDLLDFEEDQVREYTRHWCTAVRLAQNEPQKEARHEGKMDGKRIVDGFKDHPYICNLARNPLMLSAICLVNYFEGGQLPKDRVILYKLCVEGLLHHWDQRRGIHSKFKLEEKLRTCREVALAMQADDRAEYEADKVQKIFTDVLGDSDRANELQEHIRYRTGLLLERRPAVFAFAHLTFQEYLAARAVHEGNKLKIDAEKLCSEWNDPRWREVIPLFCGQTTTPAAREMIERLMAQPDLEGLSAMLAEAYLSSGQELAQDKEFRQKILERIAVLSSGDILNLFLPDEVAPIANLFVGKIKEGISEAYRWLFRNSIMLEIRTISERLREWRKMNPFQIAELSHLLHSYGPDKILSEIAVDINMYSAPGPKFSDGTQYYSQAEIVLNALMYRNLKLSKSSGFDTIFFHIINTFICSKEFGYHLFFNFVEFLEMLIKTEYHPQDVTTWPEFASLSRKLADHFDKIKDKEEKQKRLSCIELLRSWADILENSYAKKKMEKSNKKPNQKPNRRKNPKRR